ncbi:F-box domain-containing protein [Mycena indigotica]|uniref:F-box domain-containing protein n=1 Tax=Mycena indigotica TaxID=2126181 RepID=A0A8H6SQP4_9AGAR|nr:F-box domain-containing protein [Mycena indigotica]KAF7302200.1 F-box domain-containing protein [Mycena indigotica]
MVGFNALPLELTTRIFRACISKYKGEPDLVDRRQAPRLLTNVCSTWRRIAISTPVLWSSLHIDFDSIERMPNFYKLVELWLSRAGNHALDISIKGCLHADDSDPGDREDYGIEEFFAIFVPHIQHIRVFSVFLSIDDLSLLEDRVENNKFLMLEELELGMNIEDIEDEEIEWIDTSLFRSATKLRELDIQFLPLSFFKGPLRQITDFSAQGYNPQEARDALARLPGVMRFGLDECRSSVSIGRVKPLVHSTLKHLNLTLEWSNMKSQTTILQRLTLPSLEDLRLEHPAAVGNVLKEFLARSSWPALKTLHLTPLAQHAPLQLEVFHKLTSLEELVICRPKTNDLKVFCEKFGSDPAFLPKIVRLTIDFRTQKSDAQAADPASALQFISKAATNRVALKPSWSLRTLRVKWEPQLTGTLAEEHLGALEALNKKGIVACIGANTSNADTASSDSGDHDSGVEEDSDSEME